MQFGKGGGGAAGNKQNVIVLVVLAVVIAAAGFMVYRTMFPPAPSGTTDGMIPGVMAGPPGQGATPGGPAGPAGPGAPPPGVQPGAPTPGAQMPGAPPEGAPPPAPGASAPPPEPSPSAPPADAQPPAQVGGAPAPAQPSAQAEMKQIKVFGTVNVSYPGKWKISAGGGNMAAVFTDGKAFFEVHPPDPKAGTAKAIAISALKSLAKGAAVTSQGASNIGGHDAYWVAAKISGQPARIVGVDAPTRVVLFERVKGGSFDSYRKVFDQMQEKMTF